MTNKLKEHFPMLRDREELVEIIQKNEKLKFTFESWEGEKQQEFLDLCTGVKGLKVMYDPYFKEATNPEYYPERLENFLSITLKRKVKIRNILPNDSTRISDEASLLITDIKTFQNIYLHHSKQVFDSGLQLKLLQEYIMIPLDIFHKTMQNKSIETPLEAWLTFLSSDNLERIIELITKFPEFKPMYETLYRMCRNVEDTMGFFSEELRILDRNTVKYMIEDQENQLKEKEKILKEKEAQLEKMDAQLEKMDAQLEEKDAQIQMLMKQLEEYRK